MKTHLPPPPTFSSRDGRAARASILVPLVAGLMATSASPQQCPPIHLPPAEPAPIPGTPFSIQGQYFGWSLSRGGDVNGDCYADVVVGSNGRTYVLLGGPTPGSQSRELQTQDGYYYSNRVSGGVGDLDGDGFDDVAAQQISNNQVAAYRGGTYMDTYHDARFAGDLGFTPNGPSFGASLSGGDFNGDGFDDLAVGQPGGATGSGAVYLFLGSASIFSTPGQVRTYHDVLPYPQGTSQFGATVRFLGDVNSDGHEDLGICDPTALRAYVVYGNPGGNLDSLSWLELRVWGATSFGTSMAGGDADGDGDADVIVGGAGGVGHAWVFRDPVGYTPWITLAAESSGTLFGVEVDLADVDGDRRADAIVSEPEWRPSGWSGFAPGRVLLYSLAYAHLEPPELVTTYEGDPQRDDWGRFGETLAAVGDMNLDGVDDFVAGSHDRHYVQGSAVVLHEGVMRCPRLYPGDFSFDKRVDLADIGPFSTYLNTGDPRGDLTCESLVNLADVGPFSALLGTVYP